MKSIRIKNLRSLEDTKTIPLSPITLLVGKNGSGKSTFARFFMLLRQSIESRTKGPLLWFGEHVDFGSFEESINRNTNDDTISFSFTLPLKCEPSRNFFPWEAYLLNDSMVEIQLKVKGTKENKTYLKSINIIVNEDVASIELDKNTRVVEFMVNDIDILALGAKYETFERNSLLPLIKPQSNPHSEKIQRHFYAYGFRSNEIVNSIAKDLKKNFCHGRVSDEKIKLTVHTIGYGDKKSFLNKLKKIRTLGASFTENMSKHTVNSKTIDSIRAKALASTITNILMDIDEHLKNVFLNVNYIEPVRAGIIRYYREQDLSVSEIDPSGRNLPMFLRNLSDVEKKDFNEWTKINLGFEVKAHSRQGQIALHLQEDGGENEYNLADIGFGFSQILPIIAQLWIIVRRNARQNTNHTSTRILSIEQPELHLHPNYQAKVADMFVAATNLAKENNIDLKLVIETHSETIINRIGNLIYTEKLKNSDVSVVLFEKRHVDKSAEVSISDYDTSGCLQNWPYGFFQPEEG